MSAHDQARTNTWARSNGGYVTLGELEDTAHEVVPKLWQGGRHAARIVDFDPPLEVVVNLTPLGKTVSVDYSGLYLEWPIEDGGVPCEKNLHALVALLAELYEADKTILVHCQAGLNRSGLVVALVLVALNWTADAAIEQIRATRDEYALCNEEFEQYIRAWGQ